MHVVLTLYHFILLVYYFQSLSPAISSNHAQLQLIFWLILLHGILRILNECDITISDPLIILDIRHPIVDFFETRQRVSAYEAILTDNSESAIMLCKDQP